MNLLKIFGFDTDDDDYDDNDDYTEERRTRKTSSRRESRSGSSSSGKLILYKGLPSEADKRKLSDAFNDGAMILIDLHELDEREHEEGKFFLTFMKGIAYSRGGKLDFIGSSQCLITPRDCIFEMWPGEVHE